MNLNKQKQNLLSKSDKEFWDEHGYIVIKSAVPKNTVEGVLNSIWDFLEMDRNNPSDWYNDEKRKKSGIDYRGMIPLYHSQSLWNSRQSPNIYKVFSELHGSNNLLVSLDRVNMNPPETATWNYSGFIHWDIDITVQPIPFQLQGLISITNSPKNSGGFQCVPGFHNEVSEWVKKQTKNADFRVPDTAKMNIVSVPMNAGDLLVWHSALPHGNSSNLSAGPRIAQYITMFPKSKATDTDIRNRITSFLNDIPPFYDGGKQFVASPKTKPNNLIQIKLSPLGKKLLGIS